MTLANVPLFRGADAADLAALEAVGVHQDAIAGDRLFDPNHAPEALYLIEIGTVEITAKDKEMRVVELGSGQLFGEGAFFAGGQHDYSATAKEKTRLVAFPYAAVQRILDERPALAAVVYRNAARRFANMCRNMAPLLDHPYV